MEAKKLRIITAAFLSMGIVVMALYTRLDNAGFFANVLQAVPQKDNVPLVESIAQKLGDSWRSSLTSHNTITPTTTGEDGTATSSTPDTLTDRFAQSLFEQYIRGKSIGLYNTTEKRKEFIATTVKNLTASIEETSIKKSDIAHNISTTATVATYIEAVAESMKSHSIQNEHELSIFNQALQTNDPEIIAKLDPIADVYTSILADLLVMPVPPALVQDHLVLINTIQSIRNSIQGMRQLYVDPMLATVRFSTYVPATESLKTVFESLQKRGQTEYFPDGSAGEYFMNIHL